MKRKIISAVLAAALAVTTVVGSPVVSAKAAGQESRALKGITITDEWDMEGSVTDPDGFYELVPGDYAYGSAALVSPLGEEPEYETEWNFISDDETLANKGYVFFYSKCDDLTEALADHTTFEGAIPEAAFGNYVYKQLGVYATANPSDIHYFHVRSTKPIVAWASEEPDYTVSKLSNKTVRVWSIWNTSEKKKLSIASSVKVGGKSYKVTEIGDFALEDSSASLTQITLPSTVTVIGESAFVNGSNLKTININGKLKSVGKNAFSKINKKATFKIKASEKDFKKIVKLLKKGGAPKKATFKRVK